MKKDLVEDLVIREVGVKDAKGIVQILNPIIEAGIYTVFDTLFTIAVEEEYLSNFPSRGIFYVAECSKTNEILGFQNLEPFANYTHAFDHVAVIGTFIDLSKRRQGIGIALSKVTFDIAKQKGYEKIFTYVRADNKPSLRFHVNKLGFEIVGKAKKQARLGQKYIDEFLIEKFL